MPTVMLVVAALIVASASISALVAPSVLVRHYRRFAMASYYIAGIGAAWIALGAFQAVNVILQILQDDGTSPESAVGTVRMLASESVKERRAYLPALLALFLAGAYAELVGGKRARRGPPDAA